jgi:ankyrin repeat protein
MLTNMIRYVPAQNFCPVQSLSLQLRISVQNGFTALMLASSEGRVDIVQMLIASGADPNKRTNCGKSWFNIDSVRDLLRSLCAIMAYNVLCLTVYRNGAQR